MVQTNEVLVYWLSGVLFYLSGYCFHEAFKRSPTAQGLLGNQRLKANTGRRLWFVLLGLLFLLLDVVLLYKNQKHL